MNARSTALTRTVRSILHLSLLLTAVALAQAQQPQGGEKKAPHSGAFVIV